MLSRRVGHLLEPHEVNDTTRTATALRLANEEIADILKLLVVSDYDGAAELVERQLPGTAHKTNLDVPMGNQFMRNKHTDSTYSLRAPNIIKGSVKEDSARKKLNSSPKGSENYEKRVGCQVPGQGNGKMSCHPQVKSANYKKLEIHQIIHSNSTTDNTRASKKKIRRLKKHRRDPKTTFKGISKLEKGARFITRSHFKEKMFCCTNVLAFTKNVPDATNGSMHEKTGKNCTPTVRLRGGILYQDRNLVQAPRCDERMTKIYHKHGGVGASGDRFSMSSSPLPSGRPNLLELCNSPGSDLPKLRCYCNDCTTSNYTCETNGVCFAGTKRVDGDKYEFYYSCVGQEELQPPRKPLICETAETPNKQFVKVECCTTDMCNQNLPGIRNVPTSPSYSANATLWLAGGILSVALAVLVVLSLTVYYSRRRKDRDMLERAEGGESEPMILPPGSIRDLLDMTTSGSGSGLPLLVQRSIARQITLLETIGKGRFGEVWRGRWRSENVAVKIFSTRDERSWFREVEIYQTVMLRHDNILGFIAADNKDNGTWTQLWLVTDFHEKGSLFDYLMEHTVDPYTLSKMALTIANGISHLHMEIVGTQGKPAIAHRDIKSRNVLVKSDLTCAIADLGLAVRYDSATRSIDIPPNSHVGTKRYLSPEILDGTMAVHQFDSFKRADMYALGLVLWELCRRCSLIADEYQLPYFDVVAPDPSIEEMKHIVCDKKLRPTIPESWHTACPELVALSRIMAECWYENPAARLTALRVKKTVSAVGIERSSQSDSSSDVKA
ncbi:TGF-beta receptor type-1-like isoform X3 [Varroa destructor]|uniref:Serine/threonine-protein kinase receptor n=1 Tax=Varroa destructor TaxID=109461 RepID=A0A7M7K823_VARDE|nr:TGF-beta receptor type-1-like isoform X3 [Varroa destructor]